MQEFTTKQIIAALIMASDEPLTIEKLHKIFISNDNLLEINALRDVINELSNDFKGSGVELNEVASGYRFQINSELGSWVSKLYEERPPRYSRALMEILALIAYRQPITRAEIESIRGVVVSSNIIKTLLEHEWVKVVGHKEVPGRPALFATTKKFLDHFNLKRLDELPPLIEFTENLVKSAEEKGEVALAVEHDSEHPLEIEETAMDPEVSCDDASLAQIDQQEPPT